MTERRLPRERAERCDHALKLFDAPWVIDCMHQAYHGGPHSALITGQIKPGYSDAHVEVVWEPA